jgi:hypothetical protein
MVKSPEMICDFALEPLCFIYQPLEILRVFAEDFSIYRADDVGHR